MKKSFFGGDIELSLLNSIFFDLSPQVEVFGWKKFFSKDLLNVKHRAGSHWHLSNVKPPQQNQ